MENCCCNMKKTARSEEEKKAIQTRLNRLIGQMNGIKRMIDEDRYCDDVLIQLSAIDNGIKSLAHLILDAHLHSCVLESIQAGDTSVLDEVVELFRKFQ